MSKKVTVDMHEQTSVKPKVYKASQMLQAKVGTGPLDERVVEKCQEIIDNNEVDFAPLAMEYLDKLSEAVKGIKSGDLATKAAVHSLTAPVMQLKANAATFKYTLIGNLANVMLSFLEAIKELDDDAIRWLAERGYEPAYGARPLKRVIQSELQDPLAEQILAGDIHDGMKVLVTTTADRLVLKGREGQTAPEEEVTEKDAA